MYWIAAAQILAATGLGAIIGWERQTEAQRAGLRTHMLVALGAAMFTSVSVVVLESDGSRVAAQVVTGIGFLGAGAIMRDGLSVHGLTTAASLWATAAVGVAVGLGGWVPAVAGTVLAVLVLRVVKAVEKRVGQRWRTVELTADLAVRADPGRVAERIESLLPGSQTLQIATSARGARLRLLVQPRHADTLPVLADRITEVEGVEYITLGR